MPVGGAFDSTGDLPISGSFGEAVAVPPAFRTSGTDAERHGPHSPFVMESISPAKLRRLSGARDAAAFRQSQETTEGIAFREAGLAKMSSCAARCVPVGPQAGGNRLAGRS